MLRSYNLPHAGEDAAPRRGRTPEESRKIIAMRKEHTSSPFDIEAARQQLTTRARELMLGGVALCYSELHDHLGEDIMRLATRARLSPVYVALCLIDDIEANLE